MIPDHKAGLGPWQKHGIGGLGNLDSHDYLDVPLGLLGSMIRINGLIITYLYMG